MLGDLGPGADTNAVGLLYASAGRERLQVRLAVAPDALLERAAQLGLVGLADEVARLVVESRIEEEALVREPDRFSGFANTALAERDKLLAFCERTDGDRPFLEGNWHM